MSIVRFQAEGATLENKWSAKCSIPIFKSQVYNLSGSNPSAKNQIISLASVQCYKTLIDDIDNDSKNC